jgi:hypothetical protein
VRSKIFPALHIGLALELDSETTITGSCSFRTGTPGADGSPIAVGVSHCAKHGMCVVCVVWRGRVPAIALIDSYLHLYHPLTETVISPAVVTSVELMFL